MSQIIFTKHAEEKFAILEKIKCPVKRDQVIDCIQDPDKMEIKSGGLVITQKQIGPQHVLRVVFKKDSSIMKVITFYPGKKVRYEKKKNQSEL